MTWLDELGRPPAAAPRVAPPREDPGVYCHVSPPQLLLVVNRHHRHHRRLAPVVGGGGAASTLLFWAGIGGHFLIAAKGLETQRVPLTKMRFEPFCCSTKSRLDTGPSTTLASFWQLGMNEWSE